MDVRARGQSAWAERVGAVVFVRLSHRKERDDHGLFGKAPAGEEGVGKVDVVGLRRVCRSKAFASSVRAASVSELCGTQHVCARIILKAGGAAEARVAVDWRVWLET